MAHKNKKSKKNFVNFGLLGLGAVSTLGGLTTTYNAKAVDINSANFVKNTTQAISTDFANPDRGVYDDIFFTFDRDAGSNGRLYWTSYAHGSYNSSTYSLDLAPQTVASLSSYLEELSDNTATSMVGLHFNVFDFLYLTDNLTTSGSLAMSLNSTPLNALQDAVNIIRASGFKIILIPSFVDHSGIAFQELCDAGAVNDTCYYRDVVNSDMAINTYEAAIDLLSPFIEENEDIISFAELEMGLTPFYPGPSIEWEPLESGGFEDMVLRTNRNFSLSTYARQYGFLMDAVPATKAVTIDSAWVLDYFVDFANVPNPNTVVPFDGSYLSRIGMNDADTNQNIRDTLSKYTPNKPYYYFSDYSNFYYNRHWVLNYLDENDTNELMEQGYASVITKTWLDWNPGWYPNIVSRLGYRLTIDTVDFDISNEKITAQVVLDNDGYGYLVNEKDTKLLLVSEDKKYSIDLGADIRKLVDYNTNKYTLDFSSNIPEDLASGEYQVYLQIAEPYETLQNHDGYFIKLANTNTYDADQHANLLGVATIEVDEPEPEPEPDPEPEPEPDPEPEIDTPNTGMINDQNSLITLVAGSSIIAGALIKHAMRKQRKPKLSKRK